MNSTSRLGNGEDRLVSIGADGATLEGNLGLVPNARGVVLFAHGSGSSRHSARNRYVAEVLRQGGLATLLLDLLTKAEEEIDLSTARFRFDIGLLAERLIEASDWLAASPETQALPIGYFGASTGAAAALVAAAERPDLVGAIVSRGGRPDLAGSALPSVQAPTLLIVGSNDVAVIRMNREAMKLLRSPTKLELVTGATHLFEEPGTLEQVAVLARDWFHEYLAPEKTTAASQ
jgi:putative phosphoribosyl transferase